MLTKTYASLGLILILSGCGATTEPAATQMEAVYGGNIAAEPSDARASDGSYISWREHLIDDESTGGDELRGSDGLVMADLDQDGYLDIVSVHESDTEYDGNPDGLIRIAYGSADPDAWVNVTLASGAEAAAPEDVAVADVNGDGWPDVIAACELAHLIYFQNPGAGGDVRTTEWARLILPVTDGRGSFIRAFFADFDGDGVPEVTSPNKGAQNPNVNQPPSAISWFEVTGDPLDGTSWVEHELSRVVWPINAQPVDLDQDGDMDVIGGSVAESRIIFFENTGDAASGPAFTEHPIRIEGTSLTGPMRSAALKGKADPGSERAGRENTGENTEPETLRAMISGFNMDFVDLNGDGRLDIVTFEFARLLGRTIVWLEQPETVNGLWRLHTVDDYAPDEVVGLVVADINGDGRADIMTGGYSGGDREGDDNLDPDVAAGRLAWYENSRADGAGWVRHDISRRRRGMFDKFVPRDMDGDGDVDFVSTRGNSSIYDGVIWLEQVRTEAPSARFAQARELDSPKIPLP